MKFAPQALAVAWAASQANAQWSHRLNAPCGRGENSESKLMCGQTECPERMTIERRVKGRGKPRTEPGVMSNSLFNVYQTNGPDLTIDTCMAKTGLVHSSAAHEFATSCGSNAQYHTGEWWCGSDFTTSQCEFKENQFDTSWSCGDLCPEGCACTATNGGVTAGHRVLLRYDSSVLNVGDTAWVLGSRSKTSLSSADKQYRNYLQFGDDPGNCHGHVHLRNFARARLCADADCTTVVAEGEKVSFCIAETYSYGPESGWSCSGPGGGASFSCDTVQGLSPGCADLYATYTDGNWIDVTNVPRLNDLHTDGKYFLELVAGAGCRNKDYDTCSQCTLTSHVGDQTICEAETGCVWNSGSGSCEAADWCCMTQGLPDIWQNPQNTTGGRCGSDPKCYLFPEPELSMYDNNVGVVDVDLPAFGFDTAGVEHKHPCNCDLQEPTVDQFCGDGFCNTTECDASFTNSSAFYCPQDCPCDGGKFGCNKGCDLETGLTGQSLETYCSDGIDNDGNGAVDCEDEACYTLGEKFGCSTNPCGDGIDNDGNNRTDCDDPDCQSDEACLTTCLNDGESCTPGTDDTCCNSEEGSACVCNNIIKKKGCKCQIVAG